MEAIKKALQSIQLSTNSNRKFVIFCDSKSVLDSISIQETKNPIMISILDILQELQKKGFVIRFCWIPSHIGILGNEKADQLAKTSLRLLNEPNHYKIPYTDYIPKAKTYIKNLWQNRWDYKHNRKRPIKLHNIVPSIRPFYINGLSRKDEIIIHRIRIGHTRLTHKYLMEDPLKRVPPCNYCYLDNISIKHIMIECQHFDRIRSRYYRATDLKDLFERFSLKHILEFVKQAGLYGLL